jgi:hypothetical protein
MKCIAKTQKGSKCKNSPLEGTRYCFVHMPAAPEKNANTQRLVFKDALYYPFIEVPDETWLKTAALYWDTISTIAPESITSYASKTSEALRREGILTPTYVNPNLPDLEIVAEKVLGYLSSSEGRTFLSNIEHSKQSRIIVAKFTSQYEWDFLHNMKFQNGFLHD